MSLCILKIFLKGRKQREGWKFENLHNWSLCITRPHIVRSIHLKHTLESPDRTCDIRRQISNCCIKSILLGLRTMFALIRSKEPFQKELLDRVLDSFLCSHRLQPCLCSDCLCFCEIEIECLSCFTFGARPSRLRIMIVSLAVVIQRHN